MPTILVRVDCAFGLVMLMCSPTRRLSKVDLPTLGRPTTATIPERVIQTKTATVAGVEQKKKNAALLGGVHGSAGDGLLSRDLSIGVPSAL